MQEFTITITENRKSGQYPTATEVVHGMNPIEHYKRLITTDDLNWIIARLDQALTAKRRKRRSTKEPQEIVQ